MRLPKPLERLAWRGFIATSARLHELTQLTWQATLRCNLNCRHCAACAATTPGLGPELSTAEVIACFEAVARDFNPKTVGLGISGGEPLLRPDIYQICERLAELGFQYGLSTNGLLLSASAIRRLAGSGMNAVSLSLDGLPEQHEALRGAGSFEPVLRALERLRSAGYGGLVELCSCLTPEVCDNIERVHAQMMALGPHEWRIMPLCRSGRASADAALFPSGAQLKRVLHWLSALRRQPEQPLKVVFDEAGYLGEPYERAVRPGPFMCGAGINGAAILADGAVNGCIFMSRGFVQGNVRERSLKEIWETGFKPLRDRRWTHRGDCARCAEYGGCLGGCLLQWDSPEADGPGGCYARLLKDL